MRRKKRRNVPALLAWIFEMLVLFATGLMIVIAGGILLLHLFGVQTYIVMSGSMEPEIHTGAVALVDTTNRIAEEGDIIAYRIGEGEEEILITHRVVSRTPGGYITKGDANESADDKEVLQGQVIGTCIGSLPKAGFAIETLGKRGLFGIVLWITSLNILSSLLRDITARRPRKRRKCSHNDSRRKERGRMQGNPPDRYRPGR